MGGMILRSSIDNFIASPVTVPLLSENEKYAGLNGLTHHRLINGLPFRLATK